MSICKVGSRACLAGLALIILISTATSADREEAELRALVPRIVAAWGTMDISKVAPYYAADADLAYFDIAPLKYSNWKEYSEGAQKNLFEPNRSISAKLNDDLAVHRRGSLAWATFTLTIDLVSKEGRQFAPQCALDHGSREACKWLGSNSRTRFRASRRLLIGL